MKLVTLKNREFIKDRMVDLMTQTQIYIVNNSEEIYFANDTLLFVLLDSIAGLACQDRFELKPDAFVTINHVISAFISYQDGDEPIGIILAETHPKYDKINVENNTIIFNNFYDFSEWLVSEFAEMSNDEYERLTTQQTQETFEEKDPLGIWI